MEAIEEQQTFEPALEKILVRTVDYWAYKLDRAQKCDVNPLLHGTGLESGPRNNLFPLKEDVIAQTWIKICSPRAKAAILGIWADPDPIRGGYRGVTKFVSVLETRTCQDLYRKNRVRWGEVLGTSLQEVFQMSDESSDSGTMDNIFLSDERDGYGAFSLGDLKSQMSDGEFKLLKASIVDGQSCRELADEFKLSKSSVHRAIQTAQDKAQRWIEDLKHATAAETRSHIAPRFSTRPSLRPNSISAENLEAYAPHFNVVPFHDEASEWRPQTTKTDFKRARWHCVNDACQNGIAVGEDNLALPKHLRHDAVRFLPSINARRHAALGWKYGKSNVLCPTCKSQAKKIGALKLPVADDAAAIFYGEKVTPNITINVNEEMYAHA